MSDLPSQEFNSTELNNEPFFHQGDPVKSHACLLLHGLGGGVYEMTLLADCLKEQGYSVQASNYPGHDTPSFWMPNSSWEEWFEHIKDQYNELNQTHDKVSVIGFSTGSTLGLKLAYWEEIHKLVLISPFLKVRNQWYYGLSPETYVKYLTPVIRNVPRKGLPIADKTFEQHAKNARYSRTFNLTAVKSALDLIERVKVKLPDITAPTLIFQSEYDKVVDPWGAHYLMETLGSSEKEIHWLNDANHVIPLDHGKEFLFERTVEFLSD